jgi:hypothetical protein
MKRSWIVFLFVGAAGWLLAAGDPLRASASVDEGAYAPLKLYDGKWEVSPAVDEKEPSRFENHCARTGLFFVCEQVVPGKPGALVVFLPVGKTAAGYEYHTKALVTDSAPEGDWGKLTIEGQRWVYSWESTYEGKKTLWRNVNTFTGTDQIHFEIARSDDGQNWKTIKSGDEHRVK